MKNIYLIAAISLMGFSQAQNKPTEAQIAPIMAKMKLIENQAEAFPKGYFTAEEEKMLTDYLSPAESLNLHLKAPAAKANAFNGRISTRPYGNFPVSGPYTLVPTGTITTAYTIYSDDYDDNGVLYALDNLGRKLLIVNPATAAVTEVANLSGINATETLGGLSFNPVTKVWYALTSSTLGANLYTLDVRTGAATFVGTQAGVLGIWLVIDNDGEAFSADITGDNLLKVNLATGAFTTIGALGINLSFAQEADVNVADNQIYLAGYLGSGAGGIYTANKTTGATTLLGLTTPDNAEYLMFSIEDTSLLAVGENASKSKFSVFPNPVTDFIQVNSNGKIESVQIFDSNGRLVASPAASEKMDVSSLKTGAYILRLKIDGKVESMKFVKK